MPSNLTREIVQSATDFFLAPIETVKNFFGELADVEKGLLDDSLVVRVIAFINIPFKLFVGLLSLMLQNWPTSRSGWAFILAIPAVLVAASAIGAWMLADYVYNEARMIGANLSYYKYQATNNPDQPESALIFARKLVEVDPSSDELKFQLGTSLASANLLEEASDVMRCIAPDDRAGMARAHVWRANHLTANKSADEIEQSIGEAEKQLEYAVAVDPKSAIAQFQRASIYSRYADLLEANSPQRLSSLEKADKIYHDLASADRFAGQQNLSILLNSLSPSARVRKQLEILSPEKYDTESETARVKQVVENLLLNVTRYAADNTEIWRRLVAAVSETRDFAYAMEVIDSGLRASRQPDTQRLLTDMRSKVLRRAAIEINTFEDHLAYHSRLKFLGHALRTSPSDNFNYVLLLQFIGKENPAPTAQFARTAGLNEPGEAVPISLPWLLQSSTDAGHSGLINVLLGFHYFHLGDTDNAVKSWEVADRCNSQSRQSIAKFGEILAIGGEVKMDNVTDALSTATIMFPEFAKFHTVLGMHYRSQQKFDLAVATFRQSLHLFSNRISLGEIAVRHRIKLCLEYLGQRTAAQNEAKIMSERLAKTSPEFQLRAAEIIKRIEQNEAAMAKRISAAAGR